ncbi:MAG: hypothetical protein RLZZ299_684 [Pseudomonadota bacterium]
MKDPNERRAIVAMMLCLAVFYGWSAFFAPVPSQEIEAPPTVPSPSDASGMAPGTGTPTAPAAVAETCTPGTQSLRTSTFVLDVDACGRGIAGLALPGWKEPVDVLPWWTWLWNGVTGDGFPRWRPYVQKAGVERLLGEDGAFAIAGQGTVEAAGAWALSSIPDGVQWQRTTPDGLVVTQQLTKGASPDLLDLVVTWSADRPIAGPVWVGLGDRLVDVEGQYDARPRVAAVVDGDLETLLKPSEVVEPQRLDGAVDWFGLEDRYFMAAILPSDPAWGRLEHRRLDGARVGTFLVRDQATVAPGAPLQLRARMFVGQKDVERLSAVGGSLDKAADLGMFGLFAKVLLFFLGVFHAGVKNWGVAILLLTAMVRLVFYPLTASAFRSGRKMQAIQPLVKELQERHGEDKETLNREMMALFAKHQVNPLGGCLPMLVQMPVFFALYAGLMASPGLYHADFLYVLDLSAPDPYGVLPALMAVGMVLQQRLTPMTGMDPAQAQMMKLMPLVFALFMFSVPAGLSLYYTTNTLLSIAQQWHNTRSIPPTVPVAPGASA